ncbi:MAG: universal stress protein [Cyclobacteriaceae bacterium]|nr:universal stress protein [Cyclobacteriaceae bacterium SS2]
MYKFSKILVGLDLSDHDKDLIEAASKISGLSGSKEVYFINVIRDFSIPEKLKKEFPDLIEKAIDERRRSIEELVKNHFKYEEAEVVVKVLIEQGPVTKSFMKLINQYRIDLIVLGKKNEKNAGGVLVSRIARRAGCSMLMLPKAPLSFKTIHVPTDFSNYSKSALEKATTLARRSKEPSKLIIQHVYQVPVGYHYTGKSFKDFALIMKDNAKTEFKRFVSKVKTDGLNIEEMYTIDKNDDVISVIYSTAKKIKADLIIIGAKGKTATAAIFIGSKAEKLVSLNTDIPVLVVRPKGKVAGFIESLQEI